MFNATDYTYRVWYSPEDEGYIANILEYPSLSNFGETATEAMDGAVDLLADVLQDLSSEEVKVPFGRKQYSGKILLRMTPPTAQKSLNGGCRAACVTQQPVGCSSDNAAAYKRVLNSWIGHLKVYSCHGMIVSSVSPNSIMFTPASTFQHLSGAV